jgi:IS1 family transposase
LRLIYAYHRETGEIVTYVWGRRDIKTVEKLKERLKSLGVRCGSVAADAWERFISAFKGERHLAGKRYTMGIEGNNCRLRRRARRAFRRTCCFSKKLINHLKAFGIVFFYINFGFV